jgi:hypothetical protein
MVTIRYRRVSELIAPDIVFQVALKYLPCPSQFPCSLLLGYFEMEMFTYGLSIIHQCEEADVLCMIFNPGDGRFFGAQFICHLLLGKACFKRIPILNCSYPLSKFFVNLGLSLFLVSIYLSRSSIYLPPAQIFFLPLFCQSNLLGRGPPE